jgi:FAD/FMN-containing dehydrogenase
VTVATVSASGRWRGVGIYAQSTEEVQEIVRLCAAHRMPVVAFGTGTSLEGHVIDREEQALVAQVLVERLAGDAGLDDAVEVLGMD